MHYLLVACAGGGAVEVLDDPREGDSGPGALVAGLSVVEHWLDGGLQAGAKKAGEFCCAWTLQQVPFTFPWSDNDPAP